ncbi:LysR family transcriptional regulator [Amycolatopsis lurida]
MSKTVMATLAQAAMFTRMRLAPASISQTVKKPERRFGAPLFTRTTRRVELTPLGRQLLDELGPAYRQVEAAIERAITAGRGETGELHLGPCPPRSHAGCWRSSTLFAVTRLASR